MITCPVADDKLVVQLMRVLILDPVVLLLDLPTAALDDDNSELHVDTKIHEILC